MSNVLVKGTIDDVGRYHVLGVLGEGALGRLFLAEGPRADGSLERIALRRLEKKLTNDANALRALLEAAHVAATFDHKNIVLTYDIDRSDEHYYLGAKYLPGENLAAILRACADSAPMRPEIAATLVRHCVEALRYIHAHADARGAPMRLLHRDLRPSNVFVTFKGDARLLGFETGAALAVHSETRMACDGGVAYAAPEEISSAPLDARSDLFSLGALLWECLTGRRLFGADSPAKTIEAIRTRYIEPPSVFRPDIPPGLDEIALRAVTRDPRRRYQSATEMAMALDRAIAALDWRPTGADIASWLEELCGRERAALKNQVFLGTAVEASLARLRLVGAMRGALPEPIDPDTEATRPSTLEMVEPLMRSSANPWPSGPTEVASISPAMAGRATPPLSLPGLTGVGFRSGAGGGGGVSAAAGMSPTQLPPPPTAGTMAVPPAPSMASAAAITATLAPSPARATPSVAPAVSVGAASAFSAEGREGSLPGPMRSRSLLFGAGVGAVAALLVGVFWLMRSDGAGSGSSTEGVAATVGSLLVQSTPAGAQVLIDGDPSGLTTPARITGLRSGRKVNIQVDKPGYGVGRQVAEVPSGGERVIALSLVESVGVVRLTGVPARAEVYVDDVLVDAQAPISAPIGAHRLRIEWAGILYASVSLDVQKGEQTVAVHPPQGTEK